MGSFLNRFLGGKGEVSPKELAVFSRQFATLVATGIPLVQGLAILGRQTKNQAMKDVLERVRADIEAGLSITDALQRHPLVFPKLYVAMVKAGELGGIMVPVLERLSAYLEAAEALKAKVKSAMMYPVVVLGLCLGVTIFLLVLVIPRFQTIFEGFGRELPLPTLILVGLSQIVRRYFVLVLAVPAAAYYGFLRWYATPAGRRWTDSALLRLPVFGEIFTKAAVARFTRTLGTLVKAGVPILQALESVAETAGNAALAEAVLAARDSVREGGRLAPPLERSGIFPEMVTSMISVGEESGALDTMLEKIADTHDQEVDVEVKGLASLIEPIVIVIMGVIVGGVVIALFLPIIDMPRGD